tara:strand:+ start:764 stop:934 length:171 start_codon:yes stop_codon:yes gene_type:complete
MPTYGEAQKPAGVDKSPANKPLGTREMESRQTNIEPTLRIDDVPYKGNAVLNANRS